MATTGSREAAQGARLLKGAAATVAGVFLAVGIAGFIPGLTTNVDELEWVGRHDDPRAQAELFGLFHVSVLHNLVHLAFGVGLLLARTARGATLFLIGGGLIYFLVLIYGVVVEQDSDANFVPINEADNWLHAGLTIGMIALGVFLTPPAERPRRMSRPSAGGTRGRGG